jgi:hypothetical protein
MNQKLFHDTWQKLVREAGCLELAIQSAVQKSTIGRPLAQDGAKRSKKVSRCRSPEQVLSDFWKRVDIRGTGECWIWKAGKNGKAASSQYGVMWIGSKRHKTHRFVTAISHGEIDNKNRFALHRCDNPPCCNPHHLYIGTPKQNSADCKNRGRLNCDRGSDRYCAKLNEAQVARIKAEAPFRLRGWGRMIAREFGVGFSAVNNIVMGRRWKHIQPPPPRTGAGDGAAEIS